MRLTVFKYELSTVSNGTPTMMHPAMGGGPPPVLHVGPDPSGWPCLWCEVDADAPKEPRRIYVHGTGSDLSPSRGSHLGSMLMPSGYVWHVYSPDLQRKTTTTELEARKA